MEHHRGAGPDQVWYLAGANAVERFRASSMTGGFRLTVEQIRALDSLSTGGLA